MALPNPLIKLPTQIYVQIGNLKTPGVARIKGLGNQWNWNSPPAYGVSGGSSTFVGCPLTEFEIEIRMWLAVHFAEWKVIATTYLGTEAPPQTGPLISPVGPMPVEIKHPLLGLLPKPITKVTWLSASWDSPDEHLIWTLTLKCREWRRGAPAISKPVAAIPAAGKPAPNAKDATDRDIAARLAEIDRLAGQ